ncbi:uncharacterized protein [Haliotis asinina]|uniref:uncharacterized protein isoform X4 n=1 Tax=Haliotis asinina TaxID=109174 RepID=UPI003531E588
MGMMIMTVEIVVGVAAGPDQGVQGDLEQDPQDEGGLTADQGAGPMTEKEACPPNDDLDPSVVLHQGASHLVVAVEADLGRSDPLVLDPSITSDNHVKSELEHVSSILWQCCLISSVHISVSDHVCISLYHTIAVELNKETVTPSGFLLEQCKQYTTVAILCS